MKEENEKISILNIIGYIAYGGIESYLFNNAQIINKRKYKYDLISSDAGMPEMRKKLEDSGMKIYYVSRRRHHIFKHIFQMYSLLKRAKREYQILHVHLINDSYIPLIIAYLLGYKIRIVHSHTSYLNGGTTIYVRITRWLTCKFATHGIGCSKSACDFLYKNAKFPVKVVQNGIDYSLFQFDEKKRYHYQSNFHLLKKRGIINVGRLEEEKNHIFMCEIMKDCRLNEYIMYFVGEGTKRKEIEEYIKKNRLQDRVVLLGKRSDISELLNGFDIFLLPSLHEGFPIVLLEAQVNGLYCIVSDNVTQETNISGQITYLPLKKELWIEEIVNISGRDFSVFCSKDYDIHNTLSNLLTYYDEVLENL